MGDDCCSTCAEWGNREAAPTVREELNAPRGVELVEANTGATITLSPERPVIRIGRAPDNDLVLSSPMLTRRQMQFLLVDGAVYAEDLMSACGTYIDGRKIGERTKLGRGSFVQFANYTFKLVER